MSYEEEDTCQWAELQSYDMYPPPELQSSKSLRSREHILAKTRILCNANMSLPFVIH
jgi:hypothetical protein